MRTAVIIDGVRTPIGRAHRDKGFFRHMRGDDLAVACVRALLERNPIDPREVEDVVFGCSQQAAEQGLNVARNIGLMAGLPYAVGGTTVNRLCGSGLQALQQAAHAIAAGAEDVQIVGGLEHMHHLPLGQALDVNPKLFQRTSRASLQMGPTAEYLARSQKISRADQDEFALRSHRLAAAAQRNGHFQREIVPVYGQDEVGERTMATRDQCVRPDSSLESLAALTPAFLSDGTVTAGNSSPTNDGASALLVMSEEKAKSLGLKPLARIRATAVVGVEPAVMGTGPIPATKKVLQRAGLSLADIDLIELNEAFAVQALACVRALDLDLEKLNVHGSAVALGHPIGASGARIATTLVQAMRDAMSSSGSRQCASVWGRESPRFSKEFSHVGEPVSVCSRT